jgi:RecA-family ATPase
MSCGLAGASSFLCVESNSADSCIFAIQQFDRIHIMIGSHLMSNLYCDHTNDRANLMGDRKSLKNRGSNQSPNHLGAKLHVPNT